MALTKVTYVDEETLIEAQNLNDIQDAIIALEGASLPVATTAEVQEIIDDYEEEPA